MVRLRHARKVIHGRACTNSKGKGKTMAVLVAGTVDAVRTARLIIGEGFDCRCAFSVEEAQAQLGPDVQLILCNMRFDDAPMVDFLNVLREEPEYSQLRVVCFHAHGWQVSRSAHQALEAVLRTFDNARFVDLYAITRSRGVTAAAVALRDAVSAGAGSAAMQ